MKWEEGPKLGFGVGVGEGGECHVRDWCDGLGVRRMLQKAAVMINAWMRQMEVEVGVDNIN